MTRTTPDGMMFNSRLRRPRRLVLVAQAIGLASLVGFSLPLVTASSATAQASDEASFLDVVNAQRATGRNCGPNGVFGTAAPLRIDPRLAVAAKSHSADMAARRVLSHVGRDKSSLAQRLIAQGYTGSASEVVASGFPSGAALAQAMFSSPWACAALLKPSIRDMALGVATPGRTPYWTLLLATPAVPPTTVVPTTAVPVTAPPVASTSPVTTSPATTSPATTSPPVTTIVAPPTTPAPPPAPPTTPPTTAPAPPTTPPATAPPVTAAPTTAAPPVTAAPTTAAPPTTSAPTTAAPPTTPPVATTPPPPDASAAAYLDAINAQRAGVRTCGGYGTFGPVPPLKWDSRLAAAAAAHSADQAGRGVMSHSGSDGSNTGTRIQRQGYFPFSTWGENVAYWYPNLTAVINGWMTSPGHCRNIMFSGFNDVGMAVGYTPSGLPYWTQVFASQR